MEYLIKTFTRTAFGTLNLVAPNRLSILIFHRVHANTDSLFPDEPDAYRFDCLMRYVSRTFNVLTLSDAASKLACGELPPRSLVVTFDDGYADNATVALPILQRYGIAATFFISTGFLDGGRMWNDSVIECLRNTMETSLNLSEFGLGRIASISVEERRKAIELLLPKIKYLPLSERQVAINRLQRICNLSKLPTNLMMTRDQVRELYMNGMECGGHTVNHPILQSLSPQEARAEIAKGKQQLEKIIDNSISAFAYPNGKPNNDYSKIHAEIVQQEGFSCAVTTAPGAAKQGDDLFQIPRYSPWATSLPVWSARLIKNHLRGNFLVAQ